jgi:hypothetical protein
MKNSNFMTGKEVICHCACPPLVEVPRGGILDFHIFKKMPKREIGTISESTIAMTVLKNYSNRGAL